MTKQLSLELPAFNFLSYSDSNNLDTFYFCRDVRFIIKTACAAPWPTCWNIAFCLANGRSRRQLRMGPISTLGGWTSALGKRPVLPGRNRSILGEVWADGCKCAVCFFTDRSRPQQKPKKGQNWFQTAETGGDSQPPLHPRKARRMEMWRGHSAHGMTSLVRGLIRCRKQP